jgi:RNA polymerase sigma-70 factor (ECF subfamily)
MEGMVPEMVTGGLAGLYAQYRAELLRFLVARCGGSSTDAEDLLHELWIKTTTQTVGPVTNGRAYLFRMANNLVLDQVRLRHRAMARDHNWLATEGYADGAAEERPDPSLPADEVLARQQESALLLQAIAALPPGAQRALRLHRLEGLGQTEVAQVMGISRSGVEKHLAVAMKHLRNSLRNCGAWAFETSSSAEGMGVKSPTTEERS